MKYTFFILLFGITIVLNSQNSLEKFEATYQSSKSIIKSNDYEANFTVVYNGRTRENIDGRSNFLRLQQSSSEVTLVSTSTTNKTINLKGIVENYTVNFDDNNRLITISYELVSTTNRHKVALSIKPNGNVTILIPGSDYGSMQWIGELVGKS